VPRKQFTTTIDEDIQKEFKATCAKNEVTMNDVLEAFMTGYINGDFQIEKEVKLSVKKIKK